MCPVSVNSWRSLRPLSCFESGLPPLGQGTDKCCPESWKGSCFVDKLGDIFADITSVVHGPSAETTRRVFYVHLSDQVGGMFQMGCAPQQQQDNWFLSRIWSVRQVFGHIRVDLLWFGCCKGKYNSPNDISVGSISMIDNLRKSDFFMVRI